jgi:outer membrane protein TolC
MELNPETLRSTLLNGNTSVLIGLNQVYQAKSQLNIARAHLLPGGNIGAVMTLSSPPSFLLSGVSFLLPFLLPSNWFAVKASQYMLDADAASYYLIELNQYASAYSMYQTLVADLDLKDVLNEQYQNLQNIVVYLEQQDKSLGNVDPADLTDAKGAAQTAAGQLHQMDELIVQETAALRQGLGLPLTVTFTIGRVHVPASLSEGLGLTEALQQALAIAPELKQFRSLIAASKQQKWQDLFGFLNTASLGAGNTASFGSSSSSNAGAQARVDLGFASFPTWQLDNQKTDLIQIELNALSLTEGQVIESAVGSIASAKQQLTDATLAVENLDLSYRIQLQKYNDGFTDMLHVLQAQSARAAAEATLIKTRLDLDNLRINLHRAMLADQFGAIQGCHINSKAFKGSPGPFGWLKDIFSPSANRKTIDEACRAKSS